MGDVREPLTTFAQLGEVFTLGASSKGAAGTRGLGLALVRQAAHRLGGTITVTNDGGARFTVRLPASASSPVDGSSATLRADGEPPRG